MRASGWHLSVRGKLHKRKECYRSRFLSRPFSQTPCKWISNIYLTVWGDLGISLLQNLQPACVLGDGKCKKRSWAVVSGQPYHLLLTPKKRVSRTITAFLPNIVVVGAIPYGREVFRWSLIVVCRDRLPLKRVCNRELLETLAVKYPPTRERWRFLAAAENLPGVCVVSGVLQRSEHIVSFRQFPSNVWKHR